MLFIVPDEETKTPAAQQPDGSSGGSPDFKVELDLDDAPFLEEPLEEAGEEAGAGQPEAPAPLPALEEGDGKKPGKAGALLARLKANKKKLVLAGGACVILIAALVLVNAFLFSEPEPEPAGPKRITITSEPQAEPEPDPVYMVDWEPFLVELKGSEGEIRLLYVQFSTPAKDPVLQAELFSREIALRDAIYYYLKNKPMSFLADPGQRETLKQDILSVINENVTTGTVPELYFEEYVVRGS